MVFSPAWDSKAGCFPVKASLCKCQLLAPLQKTARQEPWLQHERSPGRSAKSGAFSIRFRSYRKALQSFVLQRGLSLPCPNLFTQRGVSSKDLNPRWQREPRGSQGGWGQFRCQQRIAKAGGRPLRLGCSVTSPLASALLLAGLARASEGAWPRRCALEAMPAPSGAAPGCWERSPLTPKCCLPWASLWEPRGLAVPSMAGGGQPAWPLSAPRGESSPGCRCSPVWA